MAAEDYATEAQIKRLYAVLHSLGRDPKEFKKSRNFSSYEKLTREQCSAFITELEAIEEQRKTKKAQEKAGVQNQIDEPAQESADAVLEEAHAEAEVARMSLVMRLCAIEAKKIADELCSNGGITEGVKTAMIQKFATTMFIEAMRRGL